MTYVRLDRLLFTYYDRGTFSEDKKEIDYFTILILKI